MAILAIVVTLSNRTNAQTNDTYPVLRTLDGQAYTNARVSSVTPRYIAVFFDGGGKKIPMTNLPLELKEKYHFDPAAADAAEKTETERKERALVKEQQAEADYQKLSSWTGDVYKVRIVKNLSPGQYQIQTEDAQQQAVAIPNLPRDIVTFVEKINSLRQAANSRGALAGGYAAATRMLAAQEAANVQHQLGEMIPLELSTTTILAAPTKMRAVGVPVWKYMGKPKLKAYTPGSN